MNVITENISNRQPKTAISSAQNVVLLCCCWDLSGYAQEEGGALAIFRGGFAIMKGCKFEHNFAALDGIQVSRRTPQLFAGPAVTVSQCCRQSLHIFCDGFMHLRPIVLKVGRTNHRATMHQPITLFSQSVRLAAIWPVDFPMDD
eukprot:scaffold8349_cov32-Prasinocladus_malaysianus.AAC.1